MATRKSTATVTVTAPYDTLTSARVLSACARYLYSLCDGARSWDDSGFSKAHVADGHRAAVIPPDAWSDELVGRMYPLLGHYHRQLDVPGEDGRSLLAAYRALPPPPRTDKVDCRTAFVQGGSAYFVFPYDPELGEQLYQAVRARFDKVAGARVVPITPLNAKHVTQTALDNGFYLAPSTIATLQALIDTAPAPARVLGAPSRVDKVQNVNENVTVSAPVAGDARPLTAKHPGGCAACGERFILGDAILWSPSTKQTWHRRCAGEVPPPPPPTRPAPTPRPLPSNVAFPALRVRDVLGPGGLVAQALPGYEHREHQLEGAEVVELAIATGQHANLEAGTGTGKSLLALSAAVPYALEHHRQIVISTGDKNLQGQYVNKDVPFFADVMTQAGHPLTAVLLKGRGNFLCLHRYDKAQDEIGGALGGEFTFRQRESFESWDQFAEWADDGAGGTGDLDEYGGLLTPEVRELVTVDQDQCLSRKCPFYKTCYVEVRKRQAKDSDIIIVNHALLMRDLELRYQTEGAATVIPVDVKPRDDDGQPRRVPIMILDEAHHLQDVATDAFALELTYGQLLHFSRRLDRLTTKHPEAKARAEYVDLARVFYEQMQTLLIAADAMFKHYAGKLDEEEKRTRKTAILKLGDETLPGEATLHALGVLADRIDGGKPPWIEGVDEDNWDKLARTAFRLANVLDTLLTPNQPQAENLVRYFDRSDAKSPIALHGKPIDVSELLRLRLWEAFPTTVAMSATLATAGDFGYWQEDVGCDSALELVVGSPFDYPHQSLLYTPAETRDLDPSTKDNSLVYWDALADEIEQLLLASDGRAFVLCRSRESLREVHSRLAPRLRWLVLRQGEGLERGEMLRRFRENGRAVLFGLKSFWEGVDVSGEALSLVIIDALPFTPPSDPVFAARKDRITRLTGDSMAWFNRLALPSVILQVKQGFGRLIRSRTDRGVVAIPDARLATKTYGPRVVKALPPATRTTSLDAVRAFFGTGS